MHQTKLIFSTLNTPDKERLSSFFDYNATLKMPVKSEHLLDFQQSSSQCTG